MKHYAIALGLILIGSMLGACEAGYAPEAVKSDVVKPARSEMADADIKPVDKLDRGFQNSALAAYWREIYPEPGDNCPNTLTEKAMYKNVEAIEDVELRQAEFFLRLAVCHELADNRDMAMLYAMRTVHLADVLGRDMEAERVALSFLAEAEIGEYTDFAWANKKLQDKDYAIYGVDGYSLELSKRRYKRHLKQFAKDNLEKFEETPALEAVHSGAAVVNYESAEIVSEKRGRGFNNSALNAYYRGFYLRPDEMCPATLTKKNMYKHLAHIQDVELRQAEFFLRFSMCYELTDNRDLAVLYAMRTVHLADVLERKIEAERIALSFLADEKLDEYTDFAWANKELQDKDYSRYRHGSDNLKLSKMRYKRHLGQFSEDNTREFEEKYK